LAIGEPFPESGASTGLLWDAAAVEKIWSGFSPRHASGVLWIDRPSFELGPASLLQVAAPAQPLRAVVGLGDRLQVHVPFTARMLYGSVTTTTQAEVSWNGSSPSVRARLQGGFRNVQAGAVGLTMSGIHQPIVEDSLDGTFSVSVNDVPVTRESLDRWRDQPASFDQFHRFDLSFQAGRSKDQAGPGILQLGFDTRVRLMNQVLQQIASELRFLVPPQLVTYGGLRASFEVAHGVLQTSNPLLELSGVKILSTDLLDLFGDVRVRLGDRLSNEIPLSHLIRYALGGVR
jgi:hypothetical protein